MRICKVLLLCAFVAWGMKGTTMLPMASFDTLAECEKVAVGAQKRADRPEGSGAMYTCLPSHLDPRLPRQ